MGNFNNRKRAFVKYTTGGKVIPGSIFVGYNPPKSGRWVEITYDLCCTTTTTTTSTSSTTTTTTTV